MERKTKVEIQKICYKYLTYFDIWELRNEIPFNLSQGEKQLVVLSSILALEPKCLILDEPTKNIDTYRKNKLKELLKSIRAKGKPLIIITHDYDFAEGLYDTKIHMADGRIYPNEY